MTFCFFLEDEDDEDTKTIEMMARNLCDGMLQEWVCCGWEIVGVSLLFSCQK